MTARIHRLGQIIYSENRYKSFQNNESIIEVTDDATEEQVHRNLEVGSRGKFKSNQRPVVVTNNSPECQHEFRRKKNFSRAKCVQ